jgi:hypothetical protein
MDTALWLLSIGYMKRGMNYPRWDSHKYVAKDALSRWRLYKPMGGRTTKSHALHILGMQTFTGLRPEWVEKQHLWYK